MPRGGYREGAGRKPNPNKPPKLVAPLLRPTVPAEPKQQLDPRRMAATVSELMEAFAKYNQKRQLTPLDPRRMFQVARPMKGVVPESATIAMDEATTNSIDYAVSGIGAGGFVESYATEGLVFLGYPYLSELAQRPEYRVMSETIADDATRRWIGFDVTGDATQQDDAKRQAAKDPDGEAERKADPDEKMKRIKAAGKLDKIKMLRDDQDRLDVKTRFYEACRGDGFFGRMHLFIDLGTEDPGELRMPIGDGRDELSKAKVEKGKPIKALRSIEPVWTYPQMYNALNPLSGDWYNPQLWYVMGQEIHVTRLQKFIGHPVPDLLKPAYSFGGLSMTQMAKPYVDIWLQTRQNIAEMIRSFSVMVLKTDLQTLLQNGNASDILQRMMMFNLLRDNQGAFVVNKDTEDFANVSAPLSGLHELQAQAQEHMCVQAGVLIRTGRGDVPIEQVTAFDTVLTRNGLSPVKWVGVTGYRDTLVEIEAGESVLRVTEEHPVWSQSSKAFVDARNVSHSHSLLALRNRENMAATLLGAAGGGGGLGQDISGIRGLADFCTAPFGKPIAGRFLMVMKSTTSMVTARTISLTISRWSRAQSMWRWTAERAGDFLSVISEFAISVGRDFCPLSGRRYSAVGRARFEVTRSGLDGFHFDLTKRSVPTAVGVSPQSEKRSRSSVLPPVCSVPVTRVETVKVELQPVYNIEVDGLPEFFANGILVHNSSVCRIPLVKLTGISPSGLNATSEQEIEVYDDTIEAYQNRLIRPNLERVVNFQQLSLWGEIDPEITWHFEGLRPMTEKEKGEKQKADSERDQHYVDMGAISPAEVRRRIIDDPDLPYADLDPDELPDLGDEEADGLRIPGAHPGGGEGDDPADPKKPPEGEDNHPFGRDEWRESDHPRADNGQFGSGGGGASVKPNAAKKDAATAKRADASKLYSAPTKTSDQIVAEFPGGSEAIAKTRARLADLIPTGALVSDGGHKNPDGTYTEERQALHEKLVRDLFTPERIAAALPAAGEKPVMVMLGGRGGSGKSWLTSPDGPVDGSKMFLIDADDIKSKLPGYEGWNASAYHEESSDILALVDDRARALGINTVLDATMKSEASSAMRMAVYESAGYEVEGYYMYAAPEEAATRAMSRYSKGGTFSGRFVPPEIILGNVNNEKNFDTLSSGFRKWAVYDNNTLGQKPKLVSRSDGD